MLTNEIGESPEGGAAVRGRVLLEGGRALVQVGEIVVRLLLDALDYRTDVEADIRLLLHAGCRRRGIGLRRRDVALDRGICVRFDGDVRRDLLRLRVSCRRGELQLLDDLH